MKGVEKVDIDKFDWSSVTHYNIPYNCNKDKNKVFVIEVPEGTKYIAVLMEREDKETGD